MKSEETDNFKMYFELYGQPNVKHLFIFSKFYFYLILKYNMLFKSKIND